MKKEEYLNKTFREVFDGVENIETFKQQVPIKEGTIRNKTLILIELLEMEMKLYEYLLDFSVSLSQLVKKEDNIDNVSNWIDNKEIDLIKRIGVLTKKTNKLELDTVGLRAVNTHNNSLIVLLSDGLKAYKKLVKDAKNRLSDKISSTGEKWKAVNYRLKQLDKKIARLIVLNNKYIKLRLKCVENLELGTIEKEEDDSNKNNEKENEK